MHSLTKWPLGRGSARLINGRAPPAAVPLLGFVICNGQLVATVPCSAWYGAGERRRTCMQAKVCGGWMGGALGQKGLRSSGQLCKPSLPSHPPASAPHAPLRQQAVTTAGAYSRLCLLLSTSCGASCIGSAASSSSLLGSLPNTCVTRDEARMMPAPAKPFAPSRSPSMTQAKAA